ncbi:hypothetical protein ACIA6C_14450 [Streptomyces sp. NPDC051578]|uniref:hypothetical protein n=1 Tax=Streptomyces sp. NPDC051578 TaxID=3365662 RepID=UPI0037A98F8F
MVSGAVPAAKLPAFFVAFDVAQIGGQNVLGPASSAALVWMLCSPSTLRLSLLWGEVRQKVCHGAAGAIRSGRPRPVTMRGWASSRVGSKQAPGALTDATYRPPATPEGSAHVDTACTAPTFSFSRTVAGNLAVVAPWCAKGL